MENQDEVTKWQNNFVSTMTILIDASASSYVIEFHIFEHLAEVLPSVVVWSCVIVQSYTRDTRFPDHQ